MTSSSRLIVFKYFICNYVGLVRGVNSFPGVGVKVTEPRISVMVEIRARVRVRIREKICLGELT